MPATTVDILNTDDYERDIRRAADALKAGRLVVLPTETVYGAAAALNKPDSIARLRNLEPPTRGKPLVMHLASRDEAARYLADIGDLGRRMMRKLWPGPVALVFDVPPERQQQVAAELNVPPQEIYDGSSITLRCPDHPIATEVLSSAAAPVVIRKAAGNSHSGQSADHAPVPWLDHLDLILDAGPTKYSKPSTIVKILGDKYEIVRSGVYDQRIIERLLRTTILFVCSGNTCRSPMAEAIARHQLAQKLGVNDDELEKKGITVISAGAFAMPGARATPAAVEALKPHSADLSRHRSRPLTVELIHQADFIFTMGRSHAAAVTALVPSAADKVTTLDPSGDIEDPIGGDAALYQSLAGQLQTLIEKRLAELPLP